MKRLMASTLLSLGVAVATVSAGAGPAAPEPTPIGPEWWPSQWGAEDQRGAANRMTPAKALEAARLIRSGKVYELGRTYEPGMPMFGNRHYSLTIVATPTGGPLGSNAMVWHDEMFSGEIGQIGTQFDGLGHVGVRVGGSDLFYNGFRRADFAKPYGLEKLGVENAGVFFTRGVLVDVASYKAVERLEIGYVITREDLEGALSAQSLSLRPGDAVFIRTGHGALWMRDNAKYNSGEPGIGLAAAKWLISRKIVLVGADNFGVEAVPGENEDRVWEVHQWLIARNGIYNLENLDLDGLAKDRVYEFAFVFAPLKLKGATGSPGNPIALR